MYRDLTYDEYCIGSRSYLKKQNTLIQFTDLHICSRDKNNYYVNNYNYSKELLESIKYNNNLNIREINKLKFIDKKKIDEENRKKEERKKEEEKQKKLKEAEEKKKTEEAEKKKKLNVKKTEQKKKLEKRKKKKKKKKLKKS